MEKLEAKNSKLKVVIIVLAVLLVLSAGGLAVRYAYLYFWTPSQTTVTVPNNLIGEDEKQVNNAENNVGSNANNLTGNNAKPTANRLELYEGRPGVNERFQVSNMLPGDSVTKYFCIRASHSQDLTLYFQTEVTQELKNLGDVLRIKVTNLNSGQVLYDTIFAEIDGEEVSELLKENASGETTVYYQIDVSVDTSVGNEYQGAALTADFNWYVKDEGSLTPPTTTGDTTNVILWTVLAVTALLLMLVLFWKRRKEGGKNE